MAPMVILYTLTTSHNGLVTNGIYPMRQRYATKAAIALAGLNAARDLYL
jgi:hypothetical protein